MDSMGQAGRKPAQICGTDDNFLSVIVLSSTDTPAWKQTYRVKNKGLAFINILGFVFRFWYFKMWKNKETRTIKIFSCEMEFFLPGLLLFNI